MKKKLAILYLYLLTLLLVLPTVVMAQGWTVQSVVDNVVDFVSIVAFGACTVYFMVYGVMFLMARGDPAKAKEGRAGVLWGLVGVFFVVIAWSIVQLVQDTFLGP